MSLRLLGNRLLVREVLPAEMSAGGIFIPGSVRNSSTFGGTKLFDVLQVSWPQRNAKGNPFLSEVLPGDRVITHSYTEGPMPLPDGTEIINESMVLAIIPRDDRYARAAE